MPRLTKSFIDRLEQKCADYVVWDDRISGFGVKVTPSGRKSYLLKYRSKEGRQRKPTIGVHGNITCEKARAIAEEWHREIAAGNDPSGDKSKLKESPTIAQLCDRFITDHSEVHKKESSVWLDKFFVRKYVKPSLGKLKTSSITRSDVEKFFLSLKETPSQANRILAMLSKMFNLAEDWDLRPKSSNPTDGIKKYKEEKKERYLSDEEIKRLCDVLDKVEEDAAESPYFVALIRLLLLTGARLSEIKDAKWEWVNHDMGLLMLPDSKTGAKVIHLSPAALEVLESIPRLDGNPYIIVGNVEGRPLNNAQKPWRRVRKLAELEDVRLHDLRHTFASICVSQGMSLQMVAKLLGHSQTRTSERYAHLSHDPVSGAAAQVGDIINGHTKRKLVKNA